MTARLNSQAQVKGTRRETAAMSVALHCCLMVRLVKVPMMGGVRALCIVRGVSVAPWRWFTGARALCFVCAISMAPWV